MFNPETLINAGGLLLLFFIVYGQTGLFFCFFLPGGGLMFTSGVLMATGSFQQHPLLVCGLLALAATLGNCTGYWFGRKTGPFLYRKKDSRLLKKQHLKTAENFYRKNGAPALMIGVSLPIIRTFAPIVSGMIQLNFRRFFLFTTIGSFGYVLCFVFAGYLIGSTPFLQPYLRYVVLGIILVVTVPFVIRIVREFRKKPAQA